MLVQQQAADKIVIALKESQERVQEQLFQDGQSEIVLRPLLLGLGTKNTKVIGIALGSLQRLVTSKRITPSATPAIVNASKDCVNQGVDIQLKILQMLLSLAMYSPNLHGEQLSEVSSIYYTMAPTSNKLSVFRFFSIASGCRSRGLRSCPPRLLQH